MRKIWLVVALLSVLATSAFLVKPNELLFRRMPGACTTKPVFGQVGCILVKPDLRVVEGKPLSALTNVYFDTPDRTYRIAFDSYTKTHDWEVWFGHLAGHPRLAVVLIHFSNGSLYFQELPNEPSKFSYHLALGAKRYEMIEIRCGG